MYKVYVKCEQIIEKTKNQTPLHETPLIATTDINSISCFITLTHLQMTCNAKIRSFLQLLTAIFKKHFIKLIFLTNNTRNIRQQSRNDAEIEKN